MPETRQRSVLVDTSFLITLYNDQRANHQVAKKYHRYFIRNSIVMKLSTIAISEFQQVQPITDLLASSNYIVLPFNIDHALKAAEVAFNLGGMDRRGETAANCKDDIKLVGQASYEEADFLITDDSGTLYRYCKKLKDAGMIGTVPIELASGFDGSIFNSGQTALINFEEATEDS